ncbi:MAG: Crp/Fnr family transcriptional regulator [Magnetococcales bacterium]|nr:Crp/Fnr family transcriptional regulator [Magnetococcales bacterium]
MLFTLTDPQLGTIYKSGETIVSQGEEAECLYVILEGQVDILVESDSGEGVELLGTLHKDDMFGEIACFDHKKRSATVKANGATRILSIDRKTILKRIHEDPTIVFNLMRHMSDRIRMLNEEVLTLRRQLRDRNSQESPDQSTSVETPESPSE